MKEIKLTKGFVTIVDDDDYERLCQYKWFAKDGAAPGLVYAVRSGSRHAKEQPKIRMHREILGVSDPKSIIDHIDGDGLNNQKLNLRICTLSQNHMNRKVYTREKSSRFKGVRFHHLNNNWQAYIKKDKVSHHLGVFVSEIEAATAYDKAAKSMFGEFARPNFQS